MSETISLKKNDINRREFLNIAWLASLGFLIINLGGVTYMFAKPRFRAGQFGGRFSLGNAGEIFPPPGEEPINMPKGKFWLVRTQDNRVAAIYKVCTHLGCLYNWDNSDERYRYSMSRQPIPTRWDIHTRSGATLPGSFRGPAA